MIHVLAFFSAPALAASTYMSMGISYGFSLLFIVSLYLRVILMRRDLRVPVSPSGQEHGAGRGNGGGRLGTALRLQTALTKKAQQSGEEL